MSEKDQKWDKIPSLDLEMDSDYDSRQKQKECRRHARIDSHTIKCILHKQVKALPVRIATEDHGVFDGVIADISRSGIRLTSPKPLFKGEKVKVGFKINERTVVSKAVTRWICKNEMYTTAGLEFQDLSESDAEFLGALSTASLFNKTGVFRI